ncbi:peptidase inhibitor family I36 protein [Lentzea kentuckyensis]|uniref:peptidase inhibitor family I36 protein n=1 Tax=Lentzea kentuckyensis TaxID=360086 RepID=UPI001B80E3FC|nr:peptidase inhibitor family I36 protein [Lentzea kentuckyensis]
MTFVRRISPTLTSLALLGLVGVAAPSAQAQGQQGQQAQGQAAVGAAYDTETGQALAAWDCNTGNVCFWSGFGGTGGRCTWDVADADWASGAIKCSPATAKEVRSLYNRGTASPRGVVFYRDTGFNDRIGCAEQERKVDLPGTHQVRSHQWTSGPCG